jgi:3-hydroxyisobutyrate dehydrogenase-like beta-hydroxyacid dehydrogenase
MYILHLHIRSVKKGAVLIDSSTVDPDVSKTVAAAAEAQGAVFLDAPVSGGGALIY